MDINVIRYSDRNGGTFGLLLLDGDFECYTLEDQYRKHKIKGITRIPGGEYKIVLKDVSRFDKSYQKLFGSDYHGMLHILDVPNFEGILIHGGNYPKDTAGCILVGNKANNNNCGVPFLSDSLSAFKTLYRKISKVLLNGEEVKINIIEL